MDLGAIVGVLLTLVISGVGAVFAYGRLNERVKDNTEDIADLKIEVAKAADAAGQMKSLAQAIEHMGERFDDRLTNVGEAVRELKEDIRSIRGPARRRAGD